MQFLVASVSYLKLIILVDLLSNTFLYELNLGGNKVLLVEFNKIFLFVATIGRVPHRHSVYQ